MLVEVADEDGATVGEHAVGCASARPAGTADERAGDDDLRRHQRDPAQHPVAPGARPAELTCAESLHEPPGESGSAAPDPVARAVGAYAAVPPCIEVTDRCADIRADARGSSRQPAPSCARPASPRATWSPSSCRTGTMHSCCTTRSSASTRSRCRCCRRCVTATSRTCCTRRMPGCSSRPRHGAASTTPRWRTACADPTS